MISKTDGTYSFYTLEVEEMLNDIPTGKWIETSDILLTRIPLALRCMHERVIEPFLTFSIYGDVYKTIGVKGSFQLNTALSYANFHRSHLPEKKFRLVQIQLTQARSIVAEPASVWKQDLAIRGGHKYFTHVPSLRGAVADDSGRSPDQTDDGILWLNKDVSVSIGINEAAIPVKSSRTGRCHVVIEKPEAALVIAQHYGMNVELTEPMRNFYTMYKAMEAAGKTDVD